MGRERKKSQWCHQSCWLWKGWTMMSFFETEHPGSTVIGAAEMNCYVSVKVELSSRIQMSASKSCSEFRIQGKMWVLGKWNVGITVIMRMRVEGSEKQHVSQEAQEGMLGTSSLRAIVFTRTIVLISLGCFLVALCRCCCYRPAQGPKGSLQSQRNWPQ